TVCVVGKIRDLILQLSKSSIYSTKPLLQYIQELIQQARAMVATGNYDEAVIEHINDNMNDATRQIAAFQSQVQVQQDALLVVDRQMSYMRQQLSARMLSRYQNNYHFGGSTL
ncbi:conjugal transfer protein TraH, partial [Klebsiella pneumoniae]|nr:conjugal transfer protein TraH [Klebsiella pneumoniae]